MKIKLEIREYYKQYFGFDPQEFTPIANLPNTPYSEIMDKTAPSDTHYYFDEIPLSSSDRYGFNEIMLSSWVFFRKPELNRKQSFKVPTIANKLILRRGHKLGIIDCVHTIVYADSLENLEQKGFFNNSGELPALSTETQPAILPPWEHFAALKSFAHAIPEMELENIFKGFFDPTIVNCFNPELNQQFFKALILVLKDKDLDILLEVAFAPCLENKDIQDWLALFIPSDFLSLLQSRIALPSFPRLFFLFVELIRQRPDFYARFNRYLFQNPYMTPEIAGDLIDRSQSDVSKLLSQERKWSEIFRILKEMEFGGQSLNGYINHLKEEKQGDSSTFPTSSLMKTIQYLITEILPTIRFEQDTCYLSQPNAIKLLISLLRAYPIFYNLPQFKTFKDFFELPSGLGKWIFYLKKQFNLQSYDVEIKRYQGRWKTLAEDLLFLLKKEPNGEIISRILPLKDFEITQESQRFIFQKGIQLATNKKGGFVGYKKTPEEQSKPNARDARKALQLELPSQIDIEQRLWLGFDREGVFYVGFPRDYEVKLTKF